MRLKVFPIALIAIAAASGAIATGHVEPARGTSRAQVTAQRRGLAFAQKHCSACHAVDQGISPKPEAPSFETIINTPGLTTHTLNPWLRESHNFPEIMNFEIEPGQIDALAAYMLTLKNHDYRPPIQ